MISSEDTVKIDVEIEMIRSDIVRTRYEFPLEGSYQSFLSSCASFFHKLVDPPLMMVVSFHISRCLPYSIFNVQLKKKKDLSNDILDDLHSNHCVLRKTIVLDP